MSTHTRTRTALGVLAGLAFTPPAGAQTPDAPEAVPAELALALLAPPAPGGSDPEILVGAVPADLGVPLPADGQVLGSLVRGNAATVIVRVGGPPEDAVDGYVTRLEAEAWTRPPIPERSGFVSSHATHSAHFCRGTGETVSVHATELPGGRNYLRIVHTASEDRATLCAEEPSRTHRLFDHPVPRLVFPPGVRSRGGGSGSGNGYFETRTVIVDAASHSASDLARYLAEQLGEQAWRPRSALAGGDELTTQLWERQDDEGGNWRAVLLLRALDDAGTLEALFRATRVGAAREGRDR